MQESPVSPISDAWIWNDCTKKVKMNAGSPFPPLKQTVELQSQLFSCGIGLLLHLFISQWLFIWKLLVINSQLHVQIVLFKLFFFFFLDSAFIYNNSEFISHNSGFFSQNWLQMFRKSIGHFFIKRIKKRSLQVFLSQFRLLS